MFSLLGSSSDSAREAKVRELVKTVTAHLSVLREEKLQVWIHSFNFVKKLENEVSGTCRSYSGKVRKKDVEKDRKLSDASPTFESQFGARSITNWF